MAALKSQNLELLQKYKILSSMGRSGNRYDNATIGVILDHA